MEENKTEETGLVNAVETENQEVNETSAETSVEDNPSFDANAFTEIQEVTDDVPNVEEEDKNELPNNEEVVEDDNPTIEWTIENNDESTEVETPSNEEVVEDTPVSKEIDYSVISDKIGVEIKSEEDFLAYMQEKDNKIQELQELTKGNATNDKIKNWQKYIQLSDKELMEANLKAEGFSEAEIQEAIDTYVDNGTLKIETKKIRNTLNRHIDNERNSMIEKQAESAKHEEQRVLEVRNNIKKFIDNSETMFGFKMAKDEQQLENVRKEHYKYTTEEFYKSITKDEQSMAEAAWLWKYKDVILNAAKNNGLQKGKESVLNQIVKPDTDTTTRIREESSKEFDPLKFASF